MMKKRVFKYLFLVIISLVISFLVAMSLIIITGDRISGLKYFAVPSVFIVHVIFSLTQVEARVFRKIIYSVFAIVISSVFTLTLLFLGVDLNMDQYGFWDLIIFFIIGSIGAWECLYQIDQRIVKKVGDNYR